MGKHQLAHLLHIGIIGLCYTNHGAKQKGDNR